MELAVIIVVYVSMLVFVLRVLVTVVGGITDRLFSHPFLSWILVASFDVEL